MSNAVSPPPISWQTLSWQQTRQQALTLAFSDVFYLMAALFLGAILIVPFAGATKLQDADAPPLEAH